MTDVEAWFSNSLCPRKPEGSLGRTAQDGHLDSHTAPESQQRSEIKNESVDCEMYTKPFVRDGNLGTRMHGVTKLEDSCNPLLKATNF